MKKYPHLFIILFSCMLISACEKEEVLPPFNDSYTEPYTTGSIRFQFYKINPDKPDLPGKIQQVDFTHTHGNPDDKWMFGYYRPDIRWVAMGRNNPADRFVGVGIIFMNTNLDSLPLPYTFSKNENFDAQIGYNLGLKDYFDSTGSLIGSFNNYSASARYDDFSLTLESRSNQRLKGRFSGTLTQFFERTQIRIEKGLFDIEYVIR